MKKQLFWISMELHLVKNFLGYHTSANNAVQFEDLYLCLDQFTLVINSKPLHNVTTA